MRGSQGFYFTELFVSLGTDGAFEGRFLTKFRGLHLCPSVIKISHLAKAQLSLFGEVRLQITTEKVRKYIGSWKAWELVRPLRIWLLQEEKSLSGPLFYAPIEPVFHHCYVLIRGAPWGMHIVLIFGSSVTVREYNHEVCDHEFTCLWNHSVQVSGTE